jgi:hypothetical protein
MPIGYVEKMEKFHFFKIAGRHAGLRLFSKFHHSKSLLPKTKIPIPNTLKLPAHPNAADGAAAVAVEVAAAHIEAGRAEPPNNQVTILKLLLTPGKSPRSSPKQVLPRNFAVHHTTDYRFKHFWKAAFCSGFSCSKGLLSAIV